MAEDKIMAEDKKTSTSKKTSSEVWVDTLLSPEIVGREEATTIKEKINTLAKELEQLVPGGRISVSISTNKEKFFQFEKVFSNLVKSRSIYNERGFMRDPELGSEFSELSSHIKSINKIIDKRRNKSTRRK